MEVGEPGGGASGRGVEVCPPSCIYAQDLRPPRVFISSTFEDRLLEIRFQIKKALEELRAEPVMSELDGFPTMGDRLYEDTIAAVRGCQLFILIVGHRYGSKHPEMGESITRLEYRAARDAGMRTMVFVEDSLWQIFQDNRRTGSGGGSTALERGEVFGFLTEIAEEDNCNCVAFRHADEILSNLKHQTANLLGAYLRFQEKAADWIWTERYTHRIEKYARLAWILTPDFYWDYADAEFARLVRKNVERGMKYFYLYRHNRSAAERIAEMTAEYEESCGDSWRDSVFFAGIPEESFFWCAEQVLYNPGHPQLERAILVDTMDGRNKEHKFDVELGRDRRLEFRRHFQSLWSLYSDQPLVKLGAAEDRTALEVVGAKDG
ncbi:MAG TPA: DUF4062 domain-containing protein [Solirubrobacterales bacterium]|nr:DUF4062 domain-containing protein [Solirubrobacterales bacterium]